MTSQAKRHAIAEALRAVVPTGWTVYDWPNTTPAVPAVVVGPGSPYRAPVAMGGMEGGQLRATVLYPVGAGAIAFETMDEVVDTLVAAIDLVDECAWMRTEMPGTVQSVGGAEYFAAVIEIDTL